MNGKQLKNSILQWAIQGKLVPQDPNDEPASVLLEKIRAEKARLVKEGKLKKDKNESIIYRGDDNSYYEKMPDGKVKCIDEVIPFEIPNHWSWIRLGFLFSHCSGKALNGSDKSGTEYKYITTSNLYWDRFELDKLRSMPFTDNELDKCTATKGDLLVCEGGDFGRAAIWNYDYDIKIQNHIHKLRSYYPICTRFFYYIFYLYKHIGYIGGKGIGIQGLSSGALHQIILPITSIEEQQRIVNKIEKILPIIEKYGKAQQNLDNLNSGIHDLLKKSILQEAIQGKLVEQCANDEPASKLLERIRQEKQLLVKQGKLKAKDVTDSIIIKGDDNKYYEKKISTITCIDDEIPFDIPGTWEWVRLCSVCQLFGGYAFPSDSIKDSSGYRVIRISDIAEEGFINKKIVRYSGPEIPQIYDIHIGDILMAMTGGTVGKSLYVTNMPEERMILNQRVAIIRNILIEMAFINLVVKSSYIQEIISKKKNSTNDNISMNDIKDFLIPLPPIEEQKRIVAKFNNATASIMSR